MSDHGMNIPDYAIERIARCMLPMIQAYYESEEGKKELEEWNGKHIRKSEFHQDNSYC